MKKFGLRLLCLCVALLVFATAGAAETVSLKDDFYEAVNADWMAEAVIAADKPMAGGL